MDIDLRFVERKEMVSENTARIVKVLQWRKLKRANDGVAVDKWWGDWEDVPLVKLDDV